VRCIWIEHFFLIFIKWAKGNPQLWKTNSTATTSTFWFVILLFCFNLYTLEDSRHKAIKKKLLEAGIADADSWMPVQRKWHKDHLCQISISHFIFRG
jgi:hypothetical protein